MYHGCAPEESQKDSKVSFFLKGGASFRNRLNFISAQKKNHAKNVDLQLRFELQKSNLLVLNLSLNELNILLRS